ncbi:hypothetical protein QFZ53_001491 [Microbacterium natoriense]|uniref:Uncharacterized protein n=1 Tax=Microbacterium natoriense TaxID=284570 RepID=A0AAW8EV15_9MICO|nr:hypothetical protein [Microbacterium natoriense]MDQ0647295.1 hypothetical protein [Microbacterium natoriense]
MTHNNQSTALRAHRLSGLPVLAIVTSVVTIAASIAFAGPSAQADTQAGDGLITTQDVAEALQNVQGGLLQDAVPTSPISTPDGTAAESAALDITIPGDASSGVTLSAGGFTMDISLPNADQAGQSETLADGSTAYPSNGASANAVIPTANSVQLLSIIDNNTASENYSYDLTLPAGNRLEATADGGARVVDEQDTVKVEFEPAWAQDAAGKSVPTRYTVEGNTLTQIVEHQNLTGVTYPIVADPLPVVVIVITALAMVAVAALALGVATWLVVSWWNTCRAQNKWPQLSTKNGFTARCVK